MSVDLSKMSVEEMDDWIGAASTPDLETDRLSTCYNELARRHAEVTAERDEWRQRHGASEAVLSMAVCRLGGVVEGRPTARHNFLQRVDALVAIEAAQRGGEVAGG